VAECALGVPLFWMSDAKRARSSKPPQPKGQNPSTCDSLLHLSSHAAADHLPAQVLVFHQENYALKKSVSEKRRDQHPEMSQDHRIKYFKINYLYNIFTLCKSRTSIRSSQIDKMWKNPITFALVQRARVCANTRTDCVEN
jgi:hypothetical protein